MALPLPDSQVPQTDGPPEQQLNPVGSEAYPQGMTETDALPLATSRMHPWLVFLLSNLPIPFLIIGFYYLSKYIENPDQFSPYYSSVLQLVGINIILAVSLQLINGISGQFSLGHAGFMAVGAYFAAYATKTFGDLPPLTDDGDIQRFQNAPAVLFFFIDVLMLVGLIGGFLMLLVWLSRRTRCIHPRLPTLLTCTLIVWIVADLAAGYRVGSINWFTPWSYLFQQAENLYTYVLAQSMPLAQTLANRMSVDSRQPLTFLAAMIGGSTLAALAGLVIGMPTLRLRGDYLAIATLGFGEIIRVIFVNSPAMGGSTGLTGIPNYAMAPDPYDPTLVPHYLMPWILGTILVTVLVVWRINNSAKGRCFHAVKEDEIAAASIGINTTGHKVSAFVIGAFFAGAAGALYAHKDAYLHPNRFELMRSIEIVVMVTLGGLGSISGAILAAIVLTILPELLRMKVPGFIPEAYRDSVGNVMGQIADARIAIYALLLVVMMILRPQGLLGQRELWPRFRRKARRKPAPASADLSAQLVPAGGTLPDLLDDSISTIPSARRTSAQGKGNLDADNLTPDEVPSGDLDPDDLPPDIQPEDDDLHDPKDNPEDPFDFPPPVGGKR